MGILDEAIREHLELKRQHGAGDSELKQLEDEAFGPPERPGGEAASTIPLRTRRPNSWRHRRRRDRRGDGRAMPEAEGESRSRRESPGIADLQEPPPSDWRA